MRITAITLDKGMPATITSEISAAEAIFLATLLGQQTGIAANGVWPGHGELSTAVYDCLSGEVFNRYYEDGVDEARRDAS